MHFAVSGVPQILIRLTLALFGLVWVNVIQRRSNIDSRIGTILDYTYDQLWRRKPNIIRNVNRWYKRSNCFRFVYEHAQRFARNPMYELDHGNRRGV